MRLDMLWRSDEGSETESQEVNRQKLNFQLHIPILPCKQIMTLRKEKGDETFGEHFQKLYQKTIEYMRKNVNHE
jgi:hypothetical protein